MAAAGHQQDQEQKGAHAWFRLAGKSMGEIMNESEFATLAAGVLERIEEVLDAADIDADLDRKGEGLLEITLPRGKVVVNSQAPMRQIWVAARSGGFHFEFKGGQWCDTRSGDALMEVLARVVGEGVGTAVQLGG